MELTPQTNVYLKRHFWTQGSLKINQFLRHNPSGCHETLIVEMEDGRQSGPKVPEARGLGGLGLGGQPSDSAGQNRELRGVGKGTKDPTYAFFFLQIQSVFTEAFHFGK